MRTIKSPNELNNAGSLSDSHKNAGGVMEEQIGKRLRQGRGGR